MKNNGCRPKNKKSTPRLREYFPETLVWQPELITDKNGRAELKFKLGDNITTWKMYAIASDTKGKIGVAEREVKAFQPFFVDLSPPQILTEGDEIFLPVQIRNYTEAKQTVDVEMAKADWFSFLDAEKQQIEVNSNSTQNAVFGFRADKADEDGRQKVTAIADTDSDAMEKRIVVKPNGKEVVLSGQKSGIVYGMDPDTGKLLWERQVGTGGALGGMVSTGLVATAIGAWSYDAVFVCMSFVHPLATVALVALLPRFAQGHGAR